MVFINNKCQNIDFDEAIVYNATLTHAEGSRFC